MIPEHVIHVTDEFRLDDFEAAYHGARQGGFSRILVDCAAVACWPTARVAVLSDLLRRLDRHNVAWSLNGLPPDIHTMIEFFLYRKSTRIRRFDSAESAIVDRTLGKTIVMLRHTKELYVLLQDIVFWTLLGPMVRHGFRFARSMYEITERGLRSLPIIALVSAIMGLVLAMQAALQLSQFGATIYVARLVGVTVMYELGPLLAAVLMAGRSGSAITAEIGSMVGSEEMDALRAMGVSITKYVVVPKFVALVITLPCLAVFADLVAVAASYMFCVTSLGLPGSDYIDQTLNILVMRDVVIGFIKCAADGIVISCVAVHQGLTTKGGAEGMGKSTTRSVVYSIIGIALTHLFFTFITYLTGHAAKLA